MKSVLMRTGLGSIFTAALLLVTPVTANQVDIGYQEPAQEIIDIVDAAPAPAAAVAPGGKILLVAGYPALPSIADLAAPEHRLAGRRINPDNNSISQARFMNALSFIDIASGEAQSIRGLPRNLRAIYPSWSSDGKYLAFIQLEETEAQLWRVDMDRGRAERWSNLKANAVWGNPIQWAADNETVYLLAVPKNRGAEPAKPRVPVGPIVTESRGRTAPARTYQDLLQNEHDEKLFDHYFSSEIVRVNRRGRTTVVADTAVYSDVSLSPDSDYMLVTYLQRPYSYSVPLFRFARTTDVLNSKGEQVFRVVEQPLADNLPIAFDAVVDTRRSISWRSDADATLVWTEAQDGGDPRQAAEVRDSVFQLAAPFRAEPQKLVDLSMRYAGLVAANEELALVYERMWSDRTEKLWQVDPSGKKSPVLMWERSWEDRYNDPGSPLMTRNEEGRSVLLVNNGHILLTGAGASDEGERPFIDRRELATGDTERLWRSEAPYYEVPQTALNAAEGLFLTRREGVNTPPDFFVRDLNNDSLRALTNTPHPMPHTVDISRELIHYEREDGLPMSATLFLPAGYDAERDGPLPTIIWAYPREFRSNAAAAQVSGSPYEFNRISYWRPQFLATQGYAVLDNATMPIVGMGDELPNDSFIEQLLMNSRAAIKAGADRGVTDPNRVALGGHSYGAFMTANVLAHSNLFQAGIARSGAYNRSLTPFGFQREERTVWDDPDLYIRMSPFFAAHQIKTPLLMIHGTDDNNSGTFPMQSERLYQAVKGLGGTTRLVMLPLESHGYRARESVLHMLWETVEWLDEFVKNAESEAN
ncbi:S9 family peptidase [Aliidiomarina celeris]|uniref:S9 family peptidase n=1 Tax=Aliidiomarina celeris TaxID=2249428 RepID=UPI001E318F98|nr:prolyl oligopeptidase family serine peptidase [Aliidiomarina celeris]